MRFFHDQTGTTVAVERIVMKLRAAILSVMLLGLSAWAAGGVEALRANAASLRAQVTQLRGEQLARRNELSMVSGRIESLKSQSKGSLLPGSELDQALKRSQEISGTLTELAQRLSAREGELESANLTLLDGLTGELNRLRNEFDRQTDRGARRTLIEQMRRVRGEREAVRAALPASKIPTLDVLTPTDDPEQLLEQADLLRDNEEKVRRELQVLEGRIAQRRDEQELDRRVQRFMGEESMFDDQDRRLRLQRRDVAPGEAPAATGKTAAAEPTRNTESNTDTGFQAPPTAGPITAGSAPPDRSTGLFPGSRALGEQNFSAASTDRANGPTAPAAGSGDPRATGAPGALDGRGVSITSSSDARPQIGGQRAIATGDDDEMDDLDIQRRKLQGLAEELKRKAAELEKKASQLR